MITDAPYISLRTYRRSGVAVDTPVWVAGTETTLYVFSAGEAGKVKRIRNNTTAQVAVCDMRGKLLGNWIDATAHLFDDQAEIDTALAHLSDKYGWQMWLANIGARLTGRFGRRAYIRIELAGN